MTQADEALPTWGARVLIDGAVRFRLWAPACERIELMLDGQSETLPLFAGVDGWHELTTRKALCGSRYRFRLPDGTEVPDPASCFQPEDVSGPSEVVDQRAFRWTCEEWKGRPWHTAVIYELHVGAFTPEGTFNALVDRLEGLVRLGVTAIQLMPIGDFPGRHNWGYDGVLPYAPYSSYGRPENLKTFIDTAHAHGLMVFLDVVYNHFGPEGNYLSAYAPSFFTARHHTPWGAAINFDAPGSEWVRRFVIENALYWVEEFRFDGLRLDAVHHLLDDSPVHILEELAVTVRRRCRGRQVHLILENEENDASRLVRDDSGQPTQYTAQWNDDAHHVLHTAASAETHGYYADYVGNDERLAKALAEGFAFQGEMMRFRGSARGQPSAHLPPEAFVSFLQNHDQIGNRAFGDRIGSVSSPDALNAISAVYLLLPQIPMLFMGEEWNAPQPFLFFCDFKGELAVAIREGRRKEFESFPAFGPEHTGEPIPDPDAEDTFLATKLKPWPTYAASSMERYRQLLTIRREVIVPRLPLIKHAADRVEKLAGAAFRITWRVGATEELILSANLAAAPIETSCKQAGRTLWWEGKGGTDSKMLPGWSVHWTLATL